MDITGKHVDLSIDKPENLRLIAHALSSPVRLQIMDALTEKSKSVGELSQELDIPMSTAALAVRILDEAGIITTETFPGTRGTVKLCSRRLDTVSIRLSGANTEHDNMYTMQMPIGGYTLAENIHRTCGLASAASYINEMDNPGAFYSPDRFDAQLLWFRQGMLEYRFSFPDMNSSCIQRLELSFEACSEAPMYRNPWKSDISVSINGQRLGIWTSPCDCGGRRGRLTPDWWPELSTQFGFLKTWTVTQKGSFLDDMQISDICINDLHLEDQNYIAIRIEVPADAQNVGGINLFGNLFGDYPQAILLKIAYNLDAS